MDSITQFSCESADLVALVIMGHGDLNGNISDVSSNPVLVQDVTDALCHATGDVAKVNISHVLSKKR